MDLLLYPRQRASSLHSEFKPKIEKVAASLGVCMRGGDCSAAWTEAVLLGHDIEDAVKPWPDADRFERGVAWSRTLGMVGEKDGKAACSRYPAPDRTCADLHEQMTDAWLGMLEELEAAG